MPAIFLFSRGGEGILSLDPGMASPSRGRRANRLGPRRMHGLHDVFNLSSNFYM